MAYYWAESKLMGVKRVFFETPQLSEKGGVQMRKGGVWVYSSAWYEEGIMRRLCKKTH